MSPMVTTVVPAASTSPTSADFTRTTPSMGEVTTVSLICVSVMATCARARADVGAMRQNILLAALQFELVGFADLHARPGRAPRRRGRRRCLLCADLRPPAPAAHSDCRSTAAVLSSRMRYWSYCCLRNVVVLEEILRAIPIGLGLIVLRLGVGDGGARLLDLLRPGAGHQRGQAAPARRAARRCARRCRSPACWRCHWTEVSIWSNCELRIAGGWLRRGCAGCSTWSRSMRAITMPFLT